MKQEGALVYRGDQSAMFLRDFGSDAGRDDEAELEGGEG